MFDCWVGVVVVVSEGGVLCFKYMGDFFIFKGLFDLYGIVVDS